MRRVGILVALLAVGLGWGDAKAEQLTPPEGIASPLTEPLDDELLIQDFAKTMDISIEDARLAFKTSGTLEGFQESHADDPTFGSLWASYGKGYEIHVRASSEATSEDAEGLRSALSEATGLPVVEHRGGAAYQTLTKAIQTLEREQFHFDVNYEAGVVEVWGRQYQGDFNDVVVRAARPIPPAVRNEAHTAGDVVFGGNFVCTAGFIWGGYGITGYASAAHCPDVTTTNRTWVDGQWSANSVNPVVSTVCSAAGDYEFIRFETPQNEHETSYYNKQVSPIGEFGFGIAASFYVGQPTLKIGLVTNPTSGVTTGTITGYTSTPAYQGSCHPAGTYVSVLRYSNLSWPGDSGGPVYVSSNGWKLAATHIAGPQPGGSAGNRQGNWIGNIQIPNFNSIHICTVANPCN